MSDLSFMAVSPKKLRDWLRTAAVGEMIVYARGENVDREHHTVQLVSQMRRDGLICPHQRPSLDGPGRDFIARKLERMRKGAAGMVAGPPKRDTPLGECLAMLTRAANFTLPCPTAGEIAEKLSLKNSDAARYLMRQLVMAGLIEIEDRGPRLTRIVTILETGRRTSAELIRVGKGLEG